MIVMGILGIILAIGAPGWIQSRNRSQQRVCQENLKKIDEAKEQWALEKNKSTGAAAVLADLYAPDGSLYLKTLPKCPAEGTYDYTIVGVDATCTIAEPLDHNEKL